MLTRIIPSDNEWMKLYDQPIIRVGGLLHQKQKNNISKAIQFGAWICMK